MKVVITQDCLGKLSCMVFVFIKKQYGNGDGNGRANN